ncbi:autotransporter-associated beta strand repeat-containing protein [Aeoliella sp. ICT_H6.2]|uniref:Autotransporter-associated beta strand repeat-containing protein n=1 Tax=Aeoliella straminimaris TaxID=2954799 RepID=A0A9X2F8H0_9BACT|nr:autotransporter-associated beta strand repeat-containing protein [Aeoliella straminimaris]MCO6043623.1 autotransporter-associated beta strand repeat-containing protein [Aeoliella straminimaris]
MAAAMLLGALVCSTPVAAQFTWTGAVNNQWGNPNNWSPAVPVPPGSSVTFGAANNTDVDLGANRTVGVLTFGAAVPFSLNNHTLTINGPVQTAETIAGTHTIASNVILPAVAPWNIAAAAPLEVSGAISGAGGINKVGGGVLTLSAANSYPETTQILAGQIAIADAEALASSTVIIGVDNGLDINGLDARLGALAGAGAIDLGSQNVRVGLNNASTTYAGGITGTSDSVLRQAGTGTLTLTGGTDTTPSSFGSLRSQNGQIVVDGARIDLTSSVASSVVSALTVNDEPVTLQNGADVRVTTGYTYVQDTTLTITGSDTRLESDYVQTSGLPGSPALIQVENNATLLSNNGLTLETSIAGTNTLMVQTGGTVQIANSLLLARIAGASGIVSVSGSNSSLTAENLYLGGIANAPGGTGEVTVESDATVAIAGDTFFWTSASSLVVDGATFETRTLSNDTGVASTISISDPAAGAALTIGLGDGDSTFDGLIQDASGGAGSLKKVGTGTLTLTDDNTFSGGVVFEGGIVAAGADTNLGDTSGPLTFDGGDLRFETSFDLSATRTITLNSGGGTIRTKSNSTTISQAITGTGDLTKEGTGTLTLAGANTYSGDTLINNGTLVLDNIDALQNSTVVINVDNGLDINGLDAKLGGLAGSGDLEIGAQTVDTGLNNANTTYSGVITGTSDSRLRHQGEGTLTLTGGTEATPSSIGTLRSQDENGNIVVDGARIDLTSSDFSTTTGALLARSGNVTFQNGADVRMADGSYAYATNGEIRVSGTGTSLSGIDLRASEPVGSTGSVVVESEASLDLTGDLIVGFEGNGDLEVQSGAVASAKRVVLGPLTDAVGTASVTGTNSLLTVVNNFLLGGTGSNQLGGTGTLMVVDNATVQVGNRTKFWTSLSSITVDGGTFQTDELTQGDGVVATISISDPAGDAALVVGTGDSDSTFEGLIQDVAGGRGSLKKAGAGNLTLTGVNTYTGETIIEGGTLSLAEDFLADNSDVVLDASATLDLTHGLVDTVDEFWLAGFSRAIGTHGAIGSGADFEWSQITGTGMLEVTDFAGLAGDYNADGVVDLADYTVWRNHLGAAAGTLVNDIDGGAIGSAQYATWKSNFGASTPTPAVHDGAVPEPSALLLLLAGLGVLASGKIR